MSMRRYRSVGMVCVMMLVVGTLALAAGSPVGSQGAGCAQFMFFDNASVTPTPLFQSPNNVDVDAAGNLFVTDHGAAALYGFDAAGNQILEVHSGSANPPAPGFNWPSEVAVDLAGNIYVADGVGDTVYGFRSDGTQFLTINNSTNVPSPPFGSPDDVDVDSAGNIYVTDNDSIYKFASDGTQLFRFHAGSSPAAPPISGTLPLAIDASDNIYVAMSNPTTLYGFRSDFTQFMTIDNSSPNPPNPPFPIFGVLDLVADGSGNLFVVDAANDIVYGFRPDLTQFLTINNASTNPPSPLFNNSVGLGIDPAGNIYVADTNSNSAAGRIYGFSCPAAAGNVEVTVAATPPPAVCVTLNTTIIDFGTLAFGDTSAAEDTTVTNCGDDVALTAAISDAAGTTAAWSPTNASTDTCAVGTDLFAYQLDDGATPALLENTPTALTGVLATGADRIDAHTLFMPCTGSTGNAYETVNMVFEYVATLAP